MEMLKVHASMFLAGVSESGGEKALKLWHLRNATSFNGQSNTVRELGVIVSQTQ